MRMSNPLANKGDTCSQPKTPVKFSMWRVHVSCQRETCKSCLLHARMTSTCDANTKHPEHFLDSDVVQACHIKIYLEFGTKFFGFYQRQIAHCHMRFVQDWVSITGAEHTRNTPKYSKSQFRPVTAKKETPLLGSLPQNPVAAHIVSYTS